MFSKALILFILAFLPFLSFSQTAREKKAFKLIEKHQYNSALVLLRKSLTADTSAVAAKYVTAQYFSRPQNEDYSLDSAYRYVNRAMQSFKAASGRVRNSLRKFPVDSTVITDFRLRIEELAFEEARNADSEESYTHFIKTFVASSLQGTAIKLRHKVAFADASAANTPASFKKFLENYPESEQAVVAQERLDHLIFQEGTRDKNLVAYTSYLEANPDSRYRKNVEQNIFEILTAEGSPEGFLAFVDQYPGSYFSKRAMDFLFYLLPEEQRREKFIRFKSDSIRALLDAEDSFLVPFLQKGKFGFINEAGKVVVDAHLESISDEYLCGNINEDLLVIEGGIVSRLGAFILRGDVNAMDEVGAGYVLAETSDGGILIHKSGFVFPEKDIQDARLISGQFLALQKEERWGIFSLAGRRLVEYECQKIDAIGNVLVMQINDRFVLSTASSLAAMANNEKGRFTDAFDEVRKLNTDKILVRVKNFEGVLDQNLEILVPAQEQKLTAAFFGMVATTSDGHFTINDFGEQSEKFLRLQVVNPWVAVKNTSGWMLYDPKLRIPKSVSYDSIAIHGFFALGIRNDSLEIHTPAHSGNFIVLPPQDRVEHLSANDSTAYLLVTKGRKTTVYNNKGAKMFTVSYDKIQSAGQGFFIVSQKEKKGLMNASGKLVLPVEYDAIGTAAEGTISLLRAMKFGAYDYRKGKLIKPEYEKNLGRYTGDIFTVFRNGLWGFVSAENKPLSKIEFQEIIPWTDSVAFVRKNDQYELHEIFSGKGLITGIRSISIIRNTPGDRVFILRQGEDLGVLSSANGFIIPMKFSDIVNVGSTEVPVYFTEKHVPEASLFVVIYYNSGGEFIRKEVYEQDDYEQIYCNRKK